MNNIEQQYLALLQDILDNGVEKKDRTGTGTRSVFGRQIRHKMSDGFPLLTTKKMAWKSIVVELLWFLRGDTNIKFLVDNGCNIWNGDAFKKFKAEWIDTQKTDVSTQDNFVYWIKANEKFAEDFGDLGPIYGKQWRQWQGYVPISDVHPHAYGSLWFDQIARLIHDLKTNPDSRRLMVSAWNVAELDQMTLPPCHYGFQVYTRELSFEEKIKWYCSIYEESFEDAFNYFSIVDLSKPFKTLDSTIINFPTRAISLMWSQRSVDSALGWPFNVASYGLLLELLGKMVNMVPDELICNLGDVHIYANHIDGVKEQINREPYPLPKLNINTEWWPTKSGECGVGPIDAQAVLRSFSDDNFCKRLMEEDLQLYGYQSHPKIYFPLSN